MYDGEKTGTSTSGSEKTGYPNDMCKGELWEKFQQVRVRKKDRLMLW